MSGSYDHHLLFVYGTLQDSRVIRAITGREFNAVATTLSGYRRTRVKDADYPGITANVSTEVSGLLLTDVDTVSLEKLDTFEGDYYERLSVVVADALGNQHHCTVYVFKPQWLHLLTEEPWSLEEFKRTGYQRFRDTYPNF